MREMNQLKVRVNSILLVDEKTRNNDDRLYLAVCKQIAYEIGIDLDKMSTTTFLLQRKNMGFPSYESVGRARRKEQELHAELRADANVQAMRELREEEFRKWAVAN